MICSRFPSAFYPFRTGHEASSPGARYLMACIKPQKCEGFDKNNKISCELSDSQNGHRFPSGPSLAGTEGNKKTASRRTQSKKGKKRSRP